MHTTTASLTRLALTIDADLGHVDELPTGGSAELIRVCRNGEIAIRSLEGEHPYDALLGFVAPEDWEVLGVIAPGWGTYYGGTKKGERRRVRVVHVVGRSGDRASVVRFAGDTEATVMDDTASPGRVADCIQRALNLPTEAEPEQSLMAMWWDRTLRAVAARSHPSNNGVKVQPAELDALIGERPVSWAEERWAVITAGGSPLMDGAVASWMDDGMYARTVLADMADPDLALDAAKLACSTEAWSALLRRFANAVLGDEEWCA